MTWSGQFEYMERAAQRLRIVIPATLLSIFLLLYFNFRNVAAPMVVMLSIPFGLIGGIWLVYLYGFNLSVAVAVGFIALAGVAAEIGVLVLTFIDQEIEKRRHEKGLAEAHHDEGDVSNADNHQSVPVSARLSSEEIMEAVRVGTSERVRPIAMTATAIIVGLIPILLGAGTGSEVMQRIAGPMVGGMLTTTMLSLVVLPLIYGFVLQVREKYRES